ncbi:general secretion pathway protein GspB [Actimicrobium sp. CCC2.4]|uniref:general secretion pathway protein GspB n=1 Tax=Actimicrobium sp. CCC2.4 TaxID=3048606 RepID=UPI002AC8BF00|nr:general secretion pathway protein GspB [Actimicrobium sp. CCC2.4]MEB0134313.1 general secretion pathway protein GspB [Actimicrobium sp. CCC2.4]WPX32956.1 general secretion pathway protein GspB [Actimicrobium sp. CCC2.4]
MSMILDALKKADAERQLGELPGLHTPGWTGPAPARRAALWRRGSTWFVLAVLVPGLVSLFWLNRREVPPVRLSMPVPALTAVPAVAPMAASDVALPPPLPKEIPKESPKDVPKARREPATASPERNASAAFMPLAPSAAVLTLAALPANLQRELPTLTIGGSMYSDNPAERMLLIDKRLLHEGDEVAPGLVLDSILPKGAILRYKGVRFQLMQ